MIGNLSPKKKWPTWLYVALKTLIFHQGIVSIAGTRFSFFHDKIRYLFSASFFHLHSRTCLWAIERYTHTHIQATTRAPPWLFAIPVTHIPAFHPLAIALEELRNRLAGWLIVESRRSILGDFTPTLPLLPMFIATEYRIDFVSFSIFLTDRRQLDRSYRDRIAWLRALLTVVRGIIRHREVCARLKLLEETFFRSLHLCSISVFDLKKKENSIIKENGLYVFEAVVSERLKEIVFVSSYIFVDLFFDLKRRTCLIIRVL